MADVLAILASTDDGRTSLLYGPGHSRQRPSRSGESKEIKDMYPSNAFVAWRLDLGCHGNHTSPPLSLSPSPSLSSPVAHIVAQFVVDSFGQTRSHSMPSRVVCACLFVCRQLYNTAEGIIVLRPYSLHRHISTTLTRGLRKEELEGVALGCQPNAINQCQESLIDNLLNFAGTPKVWMVVFTDHCFVHKPDSRSCDDHMARVFCCCNNPVSWQCVWLTCTTATHISCK